MILLDMDGVLTDFEGGVARLFDVQLPDPAERIGQPVHELLGVTKGQLWGRIDQAGLSFWQELEPLPWAQDLITLCRRSAELVICTSPTYTVA